LSKQKSQHILLEAARKVVNQFPNTQFLFVGQGELEHDLKILTQNLGLEKNVVFMGVRRDIADILARSDIFVLSSLWEGLPLSAIEGMASACATILTDVGGNRELIEHGKTGLIVSSGDSHGLAEAMIALIEQDDLRLSLGRAARAHVVEKFDLALMVKQYEELYQKVWESNGNGSRLKGEGMQK
jgi:glycosyltransferase involved in cell wall biosynthesis